MPFRKPGGGLTFFSILWIVGGIAGIFLSFNLNWTFLTCLSFVGIAASVGLWFQSHLARNVLMISFAIGIVMAALLIVLQEFRLRYLLHIVMDSYFIYLLYHWPETLED